MQHFNRFFVNLSPIFWWKVFFLLHAAVAVAILDLISHVSLHHLLSCYPNSWNIPHSPVVGFLYKRKQSVRPSMTQNQQLNRLSIFSLNSVQWLKTPSRKAEFSAHRISEAHFTWKWSSARVCRISWPIWLSEFRGYRYSVSHTLFEHMPYIKFCPLFPTSVIRCKKWIRSRDVHVSLLGGREFRATHCCESYALLKVVN